MAESQPGNDRKIHPCPGCGGAVECGMTNGDDTCWCCELPHVLPMSDNSDAQCFCKACLERMIAERARLRAG